VSSIWIVSQLAELAFLRGQRRFALLSGKAPADAEIRLPLVAAEVQHGEGAERLVGRLQFALHADQALARGVDSELASVPRAWGPHRQSGESLDAAP